MKCDFSPTYKYKHFYITFISFPHLNKSSTKTNSVLPEAVKVSYLRHLVEKRADTTNLRVI